MYTYEVLTISRAYKNGDFTDFIISCGGQEFAVHSVVVGSACEFFAKSLKFTGKVRLGCSILQFLALTPEQEAEERRIHLEDDDPEMIRRLVAYLYLGDYDPSDELGIKVFGNIKQHETTTVAAPVCHVRRTMFDTSQAFDECACLAYNAGGILRDSMQVAEPLTIHAAMYALADKYQVTGLGEVAKGKFEKTLHHHYNSEDFVNAVEIAYTSTPESNRGLRDAVLKAFLVCFQVNVTEIPGFEAKLETIDQLSLLLIKSWPKKEPAKSGNSVLPKSTASASASASSFPPLFSTPIITTPASGGSLFGGLGSRTPSGFGSSMSVPNTAGNAQTSQTNGHGFGGPSSSTTTR